MASSGLNRATKDHRRPNKTSLARRASQGLTWPRGVSLLTGALLMAFALGVAAQPAAGASSPTNARGAAPTTDEGDSSSVAPPPGSTSAAGRTPCPQRASTA